MNSERIRYDDARLAELLDALMGKPPAPGAPYTHALTPMILDHRIESLTIRAQGDSESVEIEAVVIGTGYRSRWHRPPPSDVGTP